MVVPGFGNEPDPELVAELADAVTAPVVAEGRLRSPQQAIDVGARCVVGSAITAPATIAERFAAALTGSPPQRPRGIRSWTGGNAHGV